MTCVVLVPLSIVAARWLAWGRVPGRPVLEALVAVPLVLPPTVLGYYVLLGLGPASVLGRAAAGVLGHPLPFSYAGLLAASLVANVPFAMQPLQRAFEGVPLALREASWVCGKSGWATFLAVELPLAWPGLVSAVALTFAHTMGEFGVVLMVGGSIPGATKTLSIAIYDRTQVLDEGAAGLMSAVLLATSLATIAVVYGWAGRRR